MKANLYRQEALDHIRSSTLGIPVRAPQAQGIAAMLAVAVVVILVIWICVGSYTRRVTVQGVLEPQNGVVHVRSPRPGKVVKIHVSPGTWVKSGSTLLTLAADQQTERHGDGSVARLKQLSDDRQRLGEDIATLEQSSKEQQFALSGELNTARSRTVHVFKQRALQADNVAIKRDLLDRMSPLLAKGYVSPLQYKEREAELLKARSELEFLSTQYEDARQTEASLSSRLKRLSDDLAEKSSLVRDRLSNVEQIILQTEAERSLLITAPADGEVTNVLVTEGSGTSPTEALATFVTDGDELVARVLVDSRAIGFIKVGTPVAVRYRSFPYEKFGLHQGRISRVPGSALESRSIAPVPGSSSGGTTYRVDVEIPKQSITVYGKTERLRAGMEVTADLLLDRRRLVEWMFEPLIGMNKRVDTRVSIP